MSSFIVSLDLLLSRVTVRDLCANIQPAIRKLMLSERICSFSFPRSQIALTLVFFLLLLLMQTKGHYIHTDKRVADTNKIQFYAYTIMLYIEESTTYKLITLFL